jgi:hypothetical protein
MWAKILKFGCIAGLIVGGALFSIAMFGDHDMSTSGVVLGYLTMLVALTAVFLGVKSYRDIELGGVIGFWRALGVGVAMSLVAAVFYVVAWEAVLAMTNTDFMSTYTAMLIEQEKAKGVSAEALAKFVQDMEEMKAMYANPLIRAAMTAAEFLPVGLLVSLITAGLLRNSRFLSARRAVATA